MSNRKKLSSHGSFQIEVKENIIWVEAQGPFNEEITKEFSINMDKAINSLDGKMFGQLALLNDLSLLTPQAAKDLTEMARLRKKRGLIAIAVVIQSKLGKALIRQQFSKIYKDADIRADFFESIDEAHSWLTELISAQNY